MSNASEPLDQWRSRTSTLAVIGRRLALRRSGQFWRGGCPFGCDENLHVYDDHFHCFGCGAHGDGVDFVMRISNTDVETVKATLASEGHIDGAQME